MTLMKTSKIGQIHRALAALSFAEMEVGKLVNAGIPPSMVETVNDLLDEIDRVEDDLTDYLKT